jgi:hypothetical protein
MEQPESHIMKKNNFQIHSVSIVYNSVLFQTNVTCLREYSEPDFNDILRCLCFKSFVGCIDVRMWFETSTSVNQFSEYEFVFLLMNLSLILPNLYHYKVAVWPLTGSENSNILWVHCTNSIDSDSEFHSAARITHLLFLNLDSIVTVQYVGILLTSIIHMPIIVDNSCQNCS